jgi:alkanesulfonate monooxygenase SsuD/methylene tetrahydromethanopterin reductase-like flavin-dependent oxidoreductase (luciferase family)
MDFGAHLPLMDFGGNPYSLDHLVAYSETAAQLGFSALSVNDHMVFSVPWLDGPTALAAVIGHSGTMTLATTVSLPVIRGPVPLAKTLGAIDRLSNGRLVVAVGPGSSEQDFDALGLRFDERWARLDESVGALRALWRAGAPPFVGRFYSTEGISLEPRPAREDGPPIWIGSWGSKAGLGRTARLADGWLASAYNTTPDLFRDAWKQLQALLLTEGKDPASFPNALATMWFYITDSRADADRVMRERMIPTIHRPEEMLWPVIDEAHQLELFWEKVRPAIGN